MVSHVITVRMGDEGKGTGSSRVKPQMITPRQIDPPVKTHLDHDTLGAWGADDFRALG